VSEVDDVVLSEKTVGELEFATGNLLETLYTLKRNSLNLINNKEDTQLDATITLC
jgi:hypothetical protein